ncbi:MAG TPA: TIM barrel protein [Bryobacteraceae bacterium]|nr:TIM barrel protein [Bryobacteraceae bacterium]
MRVSRRQLLAYAAAAAVPLSAQQQPPPPPHSANGPKVRTSPGVCLYSQVMRKVAYDELGMILRDTGLDGINLTVFPGGHVNPANAGLEMFRSVEAITGTGLDVPIISTQYVNLTDMTIREVLGICSEMGVPIFRSGAWRYGNAPDPQARLNEVQRDVAGLASIARAAKMTVAVQNLTGDNVGAAIWDMNLVLRSLDPQTSGWDFDIGNATAEGTAGAWAVALRLATPRLKAVSVRDFYWLKGGAHWKLTPCPLGDGMVDWQAFFSALAAAHFAGPLTIHVDYEPQSLMAALHHDIDFVRKGLGAAYGLGGAR